MHRFIATVKFFRKLLFLYYFFSFLRSPKWDNGREFCTGTRVHHACANTNRNLILRVTCEREEDVLFGVRGFGLAPYRMERGDDVHQEFQWVAVRLVFFMLTTCVLCAPSMSMAARVHRPSISHELPWWGAGSHRRTNKNEKKHARTKFLRVPQNRRHLYTYYGRQNLIKIVHVSRARELAFQSSLCCLGFNFGGYV